MLLRKKKLKNQIEKEDKKEKEKRVVVVVVESFRPFRLELARVRPVKRPGYFQTLSPPVYALPFKELNRLSEAAKEENFAVFSLRLLSPEPKLSKTISLARAFFKSYHSMTSSRKLDGGAYPEITCSFLRKKKKERDLSWPFSSQRVVFQLVENLDHDFCGISFTFSRPRTVL